MNQGRQSIFKQQNKPNKKKMAKKIIGILAALAVLVIIVFTIMERCNAPVHPGATETELPVVDPNEATDVTAPSSNALTSSEDITEGDTLIQSEDLIIDMIGVETVPEGSVQQIITE